MKGQSQITGKKGEYKVIGKLLDKGYPVYIPVVDIEGVDCIIRNNQGVLKEIQIKTSGKGIKEPYKIVFKWDKQARIHYVFVFYVAEEDAYWVVPTEYLTGKEGKKIYGPDKLGNCAINFLVSTHKQWYEIFKNNWDILEK